MTADDVRASTAQAWAGSERSRKKWSDFMVDLRIGRWKINRLWILTGACDCCVVRRAGSGEAGGKHDLPRASNCKDSSQYRQEDATIFSSLPFVPVVPSQRLRPVPTLVVIRRNNVVTLFQQFAEQRMRSGVAPKGLEQAFAQQLQVSPSMWSQIKSSRPIGDKLARQIEAACDQDTGWLDEERASRGLTAGEQQFLTLALKTWRGIGAEERRRLRQQLQALLRDRAR